MSEYRFSLLHTLMVVGMDILLVVSLFIGMYRASLAPDNFNNIIFFKTVLPLLAATVCLYLVGKYFLNRHRPVAQ